MHTDPEGINYNWKEIYFMPPYYSVGRTKSQVVSQKQSCDAGMSSLVKVITQIKGTRAKIVVDINRVDIHLLWFTTKCVLN